jgi:Sortase and related acyltransferases
MNIRPVDLADAAQIAEIYNHYILTSHCTFEITPLDAADMSVRISDVIEHDFPFFVSETGGEISGYANGKQFRPRPAYRHSVEVSIYIKNGIEAHGIGTALYSKLFDEITKLDFHTIIAGIALPNEPSIRLHEKFGFEKVAHFREVGFKFGKWIDVGYWQLNKTPLF